jgi:putative transposase
LSLSSARRKKLVNPDHEQLSTSRQCRLLALSRSSWYYHPAGESKENLRLMRLIDEQYLHTPWYGARQMMRHVRREGYRVGRKRISRLMQRIGIESLSSKPGMSKRSAGHPVYPYLLRGLSIDQPNQVWATDITYIPMARGFMYLVAIMD